MPSPAESSGRTIFLPFASKNGAKCSYELCTITSSDARRLRLCTGCGEALYCSVTCQKLDWKKSHKSYCGKMDRIELRSYYPLLAYVSHLCHTHPAVPEHFVLSREIDVFDGDLLEFKGEVARLVFIYGQLPNGQVDLEEWWPNAPSAHDRERLRRRLMYDGFLLPIALATCVALVAKLYTTNTYGGVQHTDNHRLRLSAGTSPIADFGVAKGSVRVVGQDRLVFLNRYDLNDGTFNQDPNDHYWIYFIDLAGDEYILDCGMFPFNLLETIQVKPYNFPAEVDEIPGTLLTTSATYKAQVPIVLDGGLWRPRERYSVLRETALEPVFKSCAGVFSGTPATTALIEFMDKIAGRQCSRAERTLFRHFLTTACTVIGHNVTNRQYLQFPEHPQRGNMLDESLIDKDAVKNEDVAKKGQKRTKKLARKMKKGEITAEEGHAAIAAWVEKNRTYN